MFSQEIEEPQAEEQNHDEELERMQKQLDGLLRG